jgi:hypothetical protein
MSSPDTAFTMLQVQGVPLLLPASTTMGDDDDMGKDRQQHDDATTTTKNLAWDYSSHHYMITCPTINV